MLSKPADRAAFYCIRGRVTFVTTRERSQQSVAEGLDADADAG